MHTCMLLYNSKYTLAWDVGPMRGEALVTWRQDHEIAILYDDTSTHVEKREVKGGVHTLMPNKWLSFCL